jgi:hypothetical protein
MYTTNSAETCEYTIKDSNIQIVVVEDQAQLDKVLPLRNKLNIKTIVQYSGSVTNDHGGFIKSVRKSLFCLNVNLPKPKLFFPSGQILSTSALMWMMRY